MTSRQIDLLILIIGSTVVGFAWLQVNLKAGKTYLKFLSLFSLLVCFGMALAVLGIFAFEVLG